MFKKKSKPLDPDFSFCSEFTLMHGLSIFVAFITATKKEKRISSVGNHTVPAKNQKLKEDTFFGTSRS